MLEFSLCCTGRREGQSEKEKGDSLGSKRVLGTEWQRVSFGRFLAKRQQSCVVGDRLKKDKRRNLWVCQQKDQVTSPELQVLHSPRSSLSQEAALCVGWVLLFFFRFGNWCRTCYTTSTERGEEGDKPCGEGMCMSWHFGNVMHWQPNWGLFDSIAMHPFISARP